MGEWEIIGAVVIGSTSILGLFGVIMKLIITPINELNVTVAKLNSTLDRLNDENRKVEQAVMNHGSRLQEIELLLARNEIA